MVRSHSNISFSLVYFSSKSGRNWTSDFNQAEPRYCWDQNYWRKHDFWPKSNFWISRNWETKQLSITSQQTSFRRPHSLKTLQNLKLHCIIQVRFEMIQCGKSTTHN